MTTYEYTTPALVKAELKATTDFASTTNPSLSTVNNWINEESEEVNVVSGRIWSTENVTDVVDYEGQESLTLKHSPVLSVTRLLYSSIALGVTGYNLADTKIEDTDYTLYSNDGTISILDSWKPSEGRKRIQIDYLTGYTTVPLRIQKLATKKVAKRILDAVITQDLNEKKSGKSVSVGSISIVKPADFGTQNYKVLKADIDALEEKLVNGTGTYRIGYRY